VRIFDFNNSFDLNEREPNNQITDFKGGTFGFSYEFIVFHQSLTPNFAGQISCLRKQKAASDIKSHQATLITDY
jgi:hypothetical protein